jgi:hypothetical protein
MAGRKKRSQTWDDQDQYTGASHYAADDYTGGYENSYDDGYSYDNGYDDEQGLILQTDQSLVGVSSTVTQHGAPLLSYTRTMSRFYKGRKQRLSLGRHKCQVCGERIRFWSFQTPDGQKTHDGCYERLAWAWTNLYAQQQHLASEGQFE